MNTKVIVSLTSHGVRVKNVMRTIFSLINGIFKDIKIVLTLYKDDVHSINEDLQLCIDNDIVELIIADKDLGPHCKYFYCMKKYKNLPIITVDDDIQYPKDTIENMYNTWLKHKDSIIARRSFNISFTNGKINSYLSWLNNFSGITSEPSHKVFATGVGGIFYPPDALKISDDLIPEILDMKYDDDTYLKVLELRNDVKVMNIVHTGDYNVLYAKNLDDEETQSIALYKRNINCYDKNISKYIELFNKCKE